MSWRAFLGALRPVILFFYARTKSLISGKVRFRQIDLHCSKDRCWPNPEVPRVTVEVTTKPQFRYSTFEVKYRPVHR